jgi:pilus assembly protein Flp/PilA
MSSIFVRKDFESSRTTIASRSHRKLEVNSGMVLFASFLKDESGATAIEYGLIAAGISVAIIATVQGLGTKLNSTFTSVKDALN